MSYLPYQIKETQRIFMALLVPTLLILLPFLHAYGNNVTNLQLPLSWFRDEVLEISLALLLVTYLVLKLAPRILEPWLAALTFFVVLLAWLQTNFFVGDYGFFGGEAPDWGQHGFYDLLQAALLLAVFVSCMAFHRTLLDNFVFLGALLLATSMIYVPGLLDKASTPGTKKYTFTSEGIYSFSSTRNVLVFVLDSAQADVAMEILSGNDELTSRFEGFTFFRNSLSAFPKTYASIPVILSGRPFDNSETLSTYLQDVFLNDSVPSKLQQAGYDTRMHSSSPHALLAHPLVADNVVDVEGEANAETAIIERDHSLVANMMLFRLTPHVAKPWIYNDGEFWFGSDDDDTQEVLSVIGEDVAGENNFQRCRISNEQRDYSRQIKTFDTTFVDEFLSCADVALDEPVFRFFHLYSPHAPYRFDEAFRYVGSKPLTREWFVRQTEGALLVLGKMLEKLENLGVMDNALILVVSDHGEGEYNVGINYAQPGIPETTTQSDSVPASLVRGGIPLMMARAPTDSGALAWSDAPVELGDVAATVLESAGLPVASGQSVFSVLESDARTRYHNYYQFSGWNVDYILPMTEYAVDGFSWQPESWSPTGRDFASSAAGGFDGVMLTFHEDGNVDSFDGRGFAKASKKGRTIEHGGAEIPMQPTFSGPGLLRLVHGLYEPRRGPTAIRIDVGEDPVGEFVFHERDGQRSKALVLSADSIERLQSEVLKLSADDVGDQGVLIREIRLQPISAYDYRLGTKINFTDMGNSSKYRTYGWSRTEVWGTSTIGHQSGIVLSLNDHAGLELAMSARLSGYVYDQWPQQIVEVRVNGRTIQTLEIKDRKKRDYEFAIPAEVIGEDGVVDVTIHYLTPMRQSEIGVSGDSRLQGIAVETISIDRKKADN